MVQKKQGIVTGIILFFVLGIVYSHGFAQKFDHKEIKQRIDGIHKSISQLNERYVDTSLITKKYDALTRNLEIYEESLNENDDRRCTKLLQENLEVRLSSLEIDVKKKMISIQRLDLLYIIMLAFGSVIGIGFAFYIVIMYNKRK